MVTCAGVTATYERLFQLVDGWRNVVGSASGQAEAVQLLTTEARLLDDHRFDDWLATWADDGVLWVPLGRLTHPATDQSLFLDDLRRLRERLGRRREPSAWSLHVQPTTVRQLSNVESIELDGGWLTVRSVSTVFEQCGDELRIWPMQQYHLFAATTAGRRLTAKVLVVPRLAHAGPHSAALL